MGIELTPLTATLLLIVFSISLGGVVLTWGEEFVSAEATELTSNAVCPIGCVNANLVSEDSLENVAIVNRDVGGV